MRTSIIRSFLTSFLVLGVMSVSALAGDLSKYRNFQLGTNLATVADQAGVSPSQATVVHSRPVLIQELAWRPRPYVWSSETDAVQEMVFSFYDGELFQIAISYDRYETEGLTAEDVVEAISAVYGTATAPPAADNAAAPRPYSERTEALARWQDPEYRFDLTRASYGPIFRLTGVLKRLEAPVQAAILEATRLDVEEAPQRDAARIATEEEAARVKLEKARLENKPNFRP